MSRPEPRYPQSVSVNVGVGPAAGRPPGVGTVSDPDPDFRSGQAASRGEPMGQLTPQPPKVETGGGVTVLTFTANKRDLVDMLGSELHGRTEGVGKGHLLLDFSNVRQLGSAELGTLLVLNRRLQWAGGRLTLFNVSDEVYTVFEATRLHTVLTICRGAPPAAAWTEGPAG